MRIEVEVEVVRREGILDPEGNAVLSAARSLGYEEVQGVRAGRLWRLSLEAASREEALARASSLADRLLANPVLERFEVRLLSAGENA